MSAAQEIRISQSCATDPRRAVQEFYDGVQQPDMGLVVFFCSSDFDLDVVAAEMARCFAGIPVVGCTTAGQFGPLGYHDAGVSGASFPASACKVATGHLDRLQTFDVVRGQEFAQSLLQQLESQAVCPDASNTFGFLLIDGLSVREEPVVRVMQHALGGIPLFGGSAGDGLKFGATHVHHGSGFHADSAVLVLVSTTLPFRMFKTQHFVSTATRMVVTEADAKNRIVREINGLPASHEYARMVGVEVGNLNPMRFASSPAVVLIDGVEYVRSIQKANPDGSLTFYCAIEEGLVLRIAHGLDLLDNLAQTLERIEADIGAPQAVLGCDCVLRKLEILQTGLRDRVGDMLASHNAFGFNTYGEQYGGVHVNQTFTGIAIGLPKVGGDA